MIRPKAQAVKYRECLEEAKRVAEDLSEYGSTQYERARSMFQLLANTFVAGGLKTLYRALSSLKGWKGLSLDVRITAVRTMNTET
ncbi:hypothetical protein PC128_g23988 [Phytophthora cactorum]|nr:hypothetical protein PC128_g23988 [Phytophthora cactorum]